MPAPPVSRPAQVRVASSAVGGDADASATPARSLTLGGLLVGAARSITSVGALTCVAGPRLATESTTAPARRDMTTVPWPQPMLVSDHEAPEPVGAPSEQPLAVPLPLKSVADRSRTGPPNLSE